jgi:hypothetical protein
MVTREEVSFSGMLTDTNDAVLGAPWNQAAMPAPTPVKSRIIPATPKMPVNDLAMKLMMNKAVAP